MKEKEINNRQIETVAEAIRNLQEYKIIELHNEYNYNNCGDNEIYWMDYLNDIMCGASPLDIISQCKDVDICDDYVIATIYGWESGDFADMEQYIYYDEIADYLIAGRRTEYNDEITYDIEDDFVNLCKEIDEEFAKYVENNMPDDLVCETWSDIINELTEEYEEQIEEININNI